MAGTLASVLIQAAMREGNLIAAGASPTAAERTEALASLNRIINGVFGNELGENLTDWIVPAPQRTAPVAANYPQFPDAHAPTSSTYPYPPKNSRIVFGSVANTVYFPEAPDDGSRMAVVQGSGAGDGGVVGAALTLNGNGRTIETANTKVYNTPVTARQWLYRADLGDWVAVVDLAAGDPCPFPAALDDLWITMLAIRLSPRYGKTVSVETISTFKKMMATMKARYNQSGVTTYGSGNFPRSLQSYAGQWFW